VTTEHDTTEAAQDHTGPAGLTAAARILADASVLVRTRAERGEQPSRDHRPRIREAIVRATGLASPPLGDQAALARSWAVQIAAMEVNAALGRGRNRDCGNLRESERTLAGYGLDIGTIGAVSTAADLLGQAARTAGQIATARTLDVPGAGPAPRYQIGPVAAGALEPGDLVELHNPAAQPTTAPVHGLVRAVTTGGDGTRTVHLDLTTPGLIGGVLALPNPYLPSVWRPIPSFGHGLAITPDTRAWSALPPAGGG
jgi:hypothetical protein